MTQATVRAPDCALTWCSGCDWQATAARVRRALARAARVAEALVAAFAAAAAAPAVAQVHALYSGEDHGVVYARQVGDQFVAFAEHPVQKYSIVMRGQLNGDRIEVDWWDVPKWGRAVKGHSQLQISQGGTRIVRKGGDDFGPETLSAIDVAQVPMWPGPQKAGRQSAADDNVTGVFKGSDDSRWYVRETPFNVVGVAEARTTGGARPGWVSVFFARRDADGRAIEGEWFDVPKGTALLRGPLRFAPRPGPWPREMLAALGTAGRTNALDPDFNVDLDAMANTIASTMQGSGAVGWSFAIAHGGSVVEERAGGIRSREVEPALPFDPHTLGQAGSYTKFPTALTLARVLRARGLDFDSLVWPFLPTCWASGPGMHTLTFGDIARHHSGFSDEDLPDNAFLNVDTLLRRGRVKTLSANAFDYMNANYDALRYIVPLVGRRADALVHLGSICGPGPVIAASAINHAIAGLFTDMMLEDTLRPAGVTEASFLPTTGNFAILYDWQDPTVPGRYPNPIGPDNAGAGYLAISARAGTQALASFEHGRVVPDGWVREMKSRLYGFNERKWRSKAGWVTYKVGGSTLRPHYQIVAYGMMFPGDVQVYLTVTSTFQMPGGILAGQMISEAYDDAFH